MKNHDPRGRGRNMMQQRKDNSARPTVSIKGLWGMKTKKADK